jgi:hypothetical protein
MHDKLLVSSSEGMQDFRIPLWITHYQLEISDAAIICTL